MVLVDTSVWIDHLKRRNRKLIQLLENGLLLIHPMIKGELALGTIKDRTEFLASLDRLPAAEIPLDSEVHYFIEEKRLSGKGIGWVDANLMVSAKLSQANLFTLDKALEKQWSRVR